ncbi:glutamate decarboxylase [Parendozoicomonas sp. Alg238-R29]|uniref:glutamate decarboxylase n=1 Tax=Parendozoicomonas sp. Alg238-R29 TaxID=2993446 RepID=UPI00248D8447|nr:glutamate decarboxylase [Parendozoicomonas sp. Alg238-R29]
MPFTIDKSHASAVQEQKLPEDDATCHLPASGMDSDSILKLFHHEVGELKTVPPERNLGSLLTHDMDAYADQLILEGCKQNVVDGNCNPYPRIIENRLIQMQAHLFHCPDTATPTGICTAGSSEAIFLALQMHRWRWHENHAMAPKLGANLNIICGADVHTCWSKFADFFNVELRVIPITDTCFTINPESVKPLIDANTLAVGVVAGKTYTGHIDDIDGINSLLVEHKKKTGKDIPIHVDAAGGGFVLPFIEPDLKWDFRLEQVHSISVSNHKYGFVYPGLGTVIFRDIKTTAEKLQFNINFLNNTMQNYSFAYSRNSAMLYAQYYMFLRLGFSGYKTNIQDIMESKHNLERKLVNTGAIRLISEQSPMPYIVITFLDSRYSPYSISDSLRKCGWIVPAYSLPPDADQIHVLRMVIRKSFTKALAEQFFRDFTIAMKTCLQNSQASINSFVLPSPYSDC